MKTSILVTYCYFEKDAGYLDNLVFFLTKAVPWLDQRFSIKYNIVINGHCSLDLSALYKVPYISVIFRANEGFDFGAHEESLRHEANNNTLDKYDYAFFINNSVRGPFLPPYYHGHYLDPLLELFHSAPEVHLVGTTINVLELSEDSQISRYFAAITGDASGPYTHVQTQCFGTDRELLKYLTECGFFQIEKNSENKFQTHFGKLIAEKEVMLSRLVLRAKQWNIACLVPEYQGLDYRGIRNNFNNTAVNGDACFKGACFNRTLHPYETIFPKINRGLMNPEIISLSEPVLRQFGKQSA